MECTQGTITIQKDNRTVTYALSPNGYTASISEEFPYVTIFETVADTFHKVVDFGTLQKEVNKC